MEFSTIRESNFRPIELRIQIQSQRELELLVCLLNQKKSELVNAANEGRSGQIKHVFVGSDFEFLQPLFNLLVSHL